MAVQIVDGFCRRHCHRQHARGNACGTPVRALVRSVGKHRTDGNRGWPAIGSSPDSGQPV